MWMSPLVLVRLTLPPPWMVEPREMVLLLELLKPIQPPHVCLSAP
jgi:hypothetical protein